VERNQSQKPVSAVNNDTNAPATITCVADTKNSRPIDESSPAITEITSKTIAKT
jgi:hypothetical protein